MGYDKKVKDLMIPLEDYPHVPYWFTLAQAVLIVREATIKFEGAFEPRAVLVFDEKYHLLGILTLKDIVRGLAGDRLRGPGSEEIVWQELTGPELKEQAQKPVGDVMSPFKVTVDADDSPVKALALMSREGIERIPVVADKRVVGIIRLTDLFKELSEALVLREPH